MPGFVYLPGEKTQMGLPLRITYNDTDLVYQVNTSPINKTTSELEILLNGETITLQKDERSVWIQQGNGPLIDPELAQALGRSVSLRFRM
ncbi:hypothetical protein ACFGVS_21505 [Mucilaginibacter sp. AW1-7]|jgi:hypothetical protein|nr:MULTISPECIES: hypothetical protein [unclassified Mucilaginibacter]WDF78431.1 hypothetical protein PQ469_00235 [Mucilaginibacter sp. KACC 22773]SEP36987.1 hypothetical protein SAMN05428947_112200 [Mucilaginibacter sp. OK283]